MIWRLIFFIFNHFQDSHTLSELNAAQPQQYTPNSSSSSTGTAGTGGTAENPVDLSNSRVDLSNSRPQPHDQRNGLLHDSSKSLNSLLI